MINTGRCCVATGRAAIIALVFLTLDDHSPAPPAPALFLGGHRQLALENLVLRHQLSVYKRTTTRPKLRTADRLFWIGLTRAWAGWRQALVIVTPDTVLRWQRRRFRKYWTQLSGRSTRGRPPVTPRSGLWSPAWPPRTCFGTLRASMVSS
jgi:hypothetical protein